MTNNIFYIFIILLFAAACTSDYLPKSKGFNRIDLPEHEYKQLDTDKHPYTFEHSIYAEAHDDTTSWEKKKNHYKIIYYPKFEAKIHLTYKSLKGNQDTLDSYLDEAYRLLYGHDKKAYGIDQVIDTTDHGYFVNYFTLSGEVPSQYQFITHDSTNHFLRGALYFKTAQKNDSLAPVIDYIKEDIHHTVNTIEWKQE